MVEDTQTSRMRGLIVDVTEQRNAADHLERLNLRLNEVSRLAGMAEVATGVLHNVGNVLNSVSVSVSLVSDRLKAPRLTNLHHAHHPADGSQRRPGRIPHPGSSR